MHMTAEVGKRYRHYKNNREYIVLAFGYFTESEPLQECVVYQAQYDTDDLGPKPVFIRPRVMFEEHIDVDGTLVPRFQEVG